MHEDERVASDRGPPLRKISDDVPLLVAEMTKVAELEAPAMDLGRIRMYELQCDDVSHNHEFLQGICMSKTRTGTTASSAAK